MYERVNGGAADDINGRQKAYLVKAVDPEDLVPLRHAGQEVLLLLEGELVHQLLIYADLWPAHMHDLACITRRRRRGELELQVRMVQLMISDEANAGSCFAENLLVADCGASGLHMACGHVWKLCTAYLRASCIA